MGRKRVWNHCVVCGHKDLVMDVERNWLPDQEEVKEGDFHLHDQSNEDEVLDLEEEEEALEEGEEPIEPEDSEDEDEE